MSSLSAIQRGNNEYHGESVPYPASKPETISSKTVCTLTAEARPCNPSSPHLPPRLRACHEHYPARWLAACARRQLAKLWRYDTPPTRIPHSTNKNEQVVSGRGEQSPAFQFTTPPVHLEVATPPCAATVVASLRRAKQLRPKHSRESLKHISHAHTHAQKRRGRERE